MIGRDEDTDDREPTRTVYDEQTHTYPTPTHHQTLDRRTGRQTDRHSGRQGRGLEGLGLEGLGLEGRPGVGGVGVGGEGWSPSHLDQAYLRARVGLGGAIGWQAAGWLADRGVADRTLVKMECMVGAHAYAHDLLMLMVLCTKVFQKAARFRHKSQEPLSATRHGFFFNCSALPLWGTFHRIGRLFACVRWVLGRVAGSSFKGALQTLYINPVGCGLPPSCFLACS